MSATIHVLDDVTVARIAAGEVIERPASVVKELVENSLDAGATDIRVEIQAGGRRLIRVTDNGAGIAAEQLPLAFHRHATSKLRDAEDLRTVVTLGFRGEALASIGAVAHVSVLTRAAGEAIGARLRVVNGRLDPCEAAGAPVGTVIAVENLFSAVPARLKFLKSEATETGHVHDLVLRYALAYPDRRLTLVSGGRTLFQSPGSGELEDALIAAYGVEVARAMLPVERAQAADAAATGDGLRLRGYAGPPHLHRATRQHITLFVNGRWVHDPSLAYAVVQAYHTLLPKGRFPIAVLALSVPPEDVDVNVHPAKTEVRFRDARPLWDLVQRGVRRSVVGGAGVAPLGGLGPGVGPGDGSRPAWAAGWPGPGRRPVPGPAPAEAAADQASFLARPAARLPLLRVIGQVAQAFIVAEGPDGLYLIDQHAAHERVMYERFLAGSGAAPSQQLLAPEVVALSPAELAVVEAFAEDFARVGFDLAPFGPDGVLVRALPDVLAGTDVGGSLRGVLEASAAGEDPVGERFEARLVRAVCKRASVKAGQTLSPEEMRALVQSLEAAESPRTCPHGRPTMVVLSAERLAREFGRS